MNEHYPSAGDDPAPDTDAETRPGPAAVRSRRLPRAGRVAAAATGRTAGWMVAAALAGSLVTLLLVPDNTTIIPVHRAAFSVRGGRPSAAHRRHLAITLPAHAKLAPAPAGGQPFVHVSRRGQVFVPGGVPGPARLWIPVPANMPKCAFFQGPGFRPAGKIQIYRRGHRVVVRGSISRPRRRPFQIVRPPAFRRVHLVVPPGGPRRQKIFQGGPGQKVFVGRRAFAFGGPGGLGWAGGLGGLGCAMLMPGNFVGPPRMWWSVAAPSRTSWHVAPAPRTSRASG